MPKQNFKSVAVKPRSSIPTPVSPAVFYKLHENTGGTCSDALGNGPDLTLFGSGTGTPWANLPWITPDGINHYLQSDSNAYLRSIFRLDQAYGHIFQAFDFYYDGDATGIEALSFIGKSDNIVGGWGVEINSSEQVIITTRGIGASNHLDSVFNGFNLAPLASTRVQLTVELIYLTATTASANLYANGASVSSIASIDLMANSATAVFGSVEKTLDAQAYTLMAQPNGTNTRARLMNSAASNGRLARWWASRHATYDSTLGLSLAQDLYKYQGELPVCMDGK